MPRRFQFSLRWLFVAMLVVAIGCVVWTKLHPLAKTLVVLAGVSFMVEAAAVALLWVTSKLMRSHL